jgi:hypothetical protein
VLEKGSERPAANCSGFEDAEKRFDFGKLSECVAAESSLVESAGSSGKVNLGVM